MEKSFEEAKSFVAPLAAAIMQSSDETRELMNLKEGKPFDPITLLEQYDCLVNMLASQYTAMKMNR